MVEIGVQKIADFATKMSNSNRKTSESKSTESSATSSTDFSSESDPGGSTQSFFSGRLIMTARDLYKCGACEFCQFASRIMGACERNYTFFLQFGGLCKWKISNFGDL